MGITGRLLLQGMQYYGEYFGNSQKILRYPIYRYDDDWLVLRQARVTEQIRYFFPYGVHNSKRQGRYREGLWGNVALCAP